MSDNILPGVEVVSDEKLAEWSADDTWRLFIVAHFYRDGQAEWMQELEQRYYAPGTPRNELFELMAYHWEGMPWWIVSVPLAERQNVVEVNRRLKWRLANGVPCLLAPRKPGRSTLPLRFVGHARPQQFGPTSPVVIKAVFPLRSPRTFTLEPDRVARGEGTPPDEPVPWAITTHAGTPEGRAKEAAEFMARMAARLAQRRADNAYRGN